MDPHRYGDNATLDWKITGIDVNDRTWDTARQVNAVVHVTISSDGRSYSVQIQPDIVAVDVTKQCPPPVGAEQDAVVPLLAGPHSTDAELFDPQAHLVSATNTWHPLDSPKLSGDFTWNITLP